ncbi:MAG: stage V sporulation protein AA, partial [Lachnospiraceae bacterium]|nr:stage V sporulation protein AA [Lachnospiraceae bacterium]
MNTVYLKIDKNVKVVKRSFCLKELGEVKCEDKALEAKVKLLKIPAPGIQGPGRYIFSIMDIIDAISKEFPGTEVNNLGEADFIVTLERKNTPSPLWQWGKTGFVCVLCFFGAAFS